MKEFTPIQRLMRAFKEAKGINPDNADWDKKYFSRHIKAGRELLKAFDEDADKAIAYMQLKKKQWGPLVDWGMEGIIRAASRDPKLNNGEVVDSSAPKSMKDYVQSRETKNDNA